MASHRTSTANRGFTLIEISVALGIMMLLFTLGTLMSLDAFRGYTFRSERETIVSVLVRARSHSMANIDGSSWGVCFRSGKYVLFKGVTCTTPQVSDEEFDANAGVASASNFSSTFPTVVFAQLSGQTSAASIQITEEGRTSSISLNHEGTIIW
jgi:prepilin-type N-terminal cleavage/methylation domain-containing protein